MSDPDPDAMPIEQAVAAGPFPRVGFAEGWGWCIFTGHGVIACGSEDAARSELSRVMKRMQEGKS